MSAHPEETDLLEFAEGALDPTARIAVLDHLDSCTRCRQVVSALTRKTTERSVVAEAADSANIRTQSGDPLIGQMLGEYRILERLGQGGMGVLYRGEQPVIGKPVAVKVLLQELADDPNLVHRLLEEARAVNAIRHPNIVDIFSFGQLPDGRHYMVMELLEGQSLGGLLRERSKLMVADAMVVLSQSMAALEAAHAAGVIHRDLKPDNIFVNPRDDGWIVTLLDFGIAKRKGASSVTAVDVVMGTPGYMAPEQIRGTPVSPKTDIYAMGVLAWRVLAGHQVFEGGTMLDVLQRHLNEEPARVGTARPGIPPALDDLLAQMLEKRPDARPTATAVRKALAQIARQQPAMNTVIGMSPLRDSLKRLDPVVTSPATPAAPPAPGKLTALTVERPKLRDAVESLGAETDETPMRLDSAAKATARTVETPMLPDFVAEPLPTRRMRAEEVRGGLKTVAAAPGLPPVFSAVVRPVYAPKTVVSGGEPTWLEAIIRNNRMRALIGLAIGVGLALAGGLVFFGFFPRAPVPEVITDAGRITTPTPEPIAPPIPPPEPASGPGPVATPVPGPIEPVAPVSPPLKPGRLPPPSVSKPDVEKGLVSAREKAAKLTVAGTRRIVELGLDRLEERLKNGEAPGAIAKELKALLKQYDLS